MDAVRNPGLLQRRRFGPREDACTRKRIEEIFGWLETVGGLRKSRFVGLQRSGLYVYLAASAYNLLPIAKFAPALPYPADNQLCEVRSLRSWRLTVLVPQIQIKKYALTLTT